jgi:erythritol transport system substrate-binding protein
MKASLLLGILVLVGCQRADRGTPLISIIIPSQDNPYFKAEADAANERAQQLGYRTRVDSHNDDAYRQDNLIDAAIASGARAIILDNAGSESSISAVRRATGQGVAVFLIDREIQTDGIAKAQIIADNDQGARIVAEEFARAAGASGEYAELLGRESDTNAQIRTKGFHSILDSHPNLKLVAAQSANWSQAEAFQKVETILQAHPKLSGIIAGNDTMALGAAAAVKSAGLRNLIITGFDGSPDAVSAIRGGDLRATSLQPAVFIARAAAEEADNFLKHGSTAKPERQIIACDLVTAKNVDDYRDFEKIR